MKIIGCELFEVAVPTRRAHKWATSTQDVGDGYLIVMLRTDNNIEGYGESTAMAEWGGDFGRYYGETAATTRVVIENHLFPAICDMDPFDIDLIHLKMDKAIRGYPYAKTAMDVALYDVMGKALDRPVYKLLGGCHRQRIPIAHSLGLMPVDDAVEEAVVAVNEGICNIKIKGGLDYNRDLELIKKLRNTLRPEVSLVLDANQSYPTAKEAVKWCKRMDAYNLFYIEQPVEGLEPMRQVTQMLEVPVCADESCWTLADGIDLIRNAAADFFSLYTTKPGGLYPARMLAKLAENASIRCNVNGSGEFGIGNAANLHLAASGRNINLPSVIPVTNIAGKEQTKVAGRFFIDDIITKPFLYEDGHLVVPDTPGLGIEVDMQKMQKYAVKK